MGPSAPEPIPEIDSACLPPVIVGVAALTDAASRGESIPSLARWLGAIAATPAATLFDAAVLHAICGRSVEALQLQAEAIAASPLFRVRRLAGGPAAIRLLAVMTPGRVMDNTPLDFITAISTSSSTFSSSAKARPCRPAVPEHDALFFAAREYTPALRERMACLFQTWPRPVLNDPALLPRLDRDRLPAVLRGVPGLSIPRTAAANRPALARGLPSGFGYPVLIRPEDSHAGHGLARLESAADLPGYLAAEPGDAFYLTDFQDYRDAQGLYRKYRIALIDGRAYLCHLALSEHWMVHYATAGMQASPAKRAAEEAAMAGFTTGFARRHARALRSLQARIGLDYCVIDCAETPAGDLLIFEADPAAIIHRMDAHGAFAYKAAPMQHAMAAFDGMLRRVMCGSSAPGSRRSAATHPPGRKIPA